jgi:hypothetical protein
MAILTALFMLLKFVGMKMPLFAISCSEKFFRRHRLSSLCGPPGGRGRPPHQILHVLRVGNWPMSNCSEKSFVRLTHQSI